MNSAYGRRIVLLNFMGAPGPWRLRQAAICSVMHRGRPNDIKRYEAELLGATAAGHGFGHSFHQISEKNKVQRTWTLFHMETAPVSGPRFLAWSTITGEDEMVRETADTVPQREDPPGRDVMLQNEGVVIGEIQLILAEKRTSLSALRTGIAVYVLPLSVLSLLVTTSKYYDVYQVLQFLLPLLVLCGTLVILGTYLVIRAIMRIRHHDQLILQLKKKHSQLAELID